MKIILLNAKTDEKAKKLPKKKYYIEQVSHIVYFSKTTACNKLLKETWKADTFKSVADCQISCLVTCSDRIHNWPFESNYLSQYFLLFTTQENRITIVRSILSRFGEISYES